MGGVNQVVSHAHQLALVGSQRDQAGTSAMGVRASGA